MKKSKKGGLVNIVIIIVIAIMSVSLIYVLFGERFIETGEQFLEEAADKARYDFLAMRLKMLDSPVGEDECGNGLGKSERFTGEACDVNNDYDYASGIRDCCCCNVTSHFFDFGQMYAYTNVQFKFEPHSKDDPITVQGFYSKTIDGTYISIPNCEKTFKERDLTIIDKTMREGYILSCYIRETVNLEHATFRYAELRSGSNHAIDYARAELYPGIRICEVGPSDQLEPGKGYWVYSTSNVEEEVTIGVWDYMSPIAIINADPISVFTFENIIFSGEGSFSPTPGCGIVAYRWDFGDGTTTSGKTAIHSYSEEDIYRVSLEVEDCDGKTGRSSVLVYVNNQYPRPILNIYYEGFYWEGMPL